MSTLRQILRAYRLLPEQLIRLDPDLFDRLEILAATRQKSVAAVVLEILAVAVDEMNGQSANGRRWNTLTPREQQVAALACLGYTNDEIATWLTISVNTVRTHMRSILDKYKVSSKAELRLCLANWDFAGWLAAEWPPAGSLPPAD